MRYALFLLLFAINAAFAQPSLSVLNARLKTQTESDQINTCIQISKIFEINQPDSAVDYCYRGIKLAEKLNDRHGQALLLLQMARINSLHNHTDLARRFNNESLSIFRSLNDAEGVARAYDELGLIDGEQENIVSANRDLGQAIKFYRQANDSSGIAATYHDIGTAYEEKGETEKALSYYLRALVRYEHYQKKPVDYFTLLEKIGHLYIKKGDSKTALRYLTEGVHNSNLESTRDTQITLLDEEGEVFEKEGESTRALNYYKLALNEAKKFNRPAEQAQALINIAGVLRRENMAGSLGDLKKALRLAEDIHNAQLQAKIYSALSGVYQQQKNYKEAMVALEENHRLVDSLLGADTTKDIAAMDTSYKLESSLDQIGHLEQVNKQKQIQLDMGLAILAAIVIIIILLWLYLRRARRLNNELKASNKVRDTLFSIIGHDLKGPVGVTSQLVTLMETEDLTEAELRDMLPELRKQTNISFELLVALFEWGQAQLQGVKVKPEYVETRQRIQKNISLLAQQAAAKNITINDNTPNGMVIYTDPNHFDFIVRNLLSNAIKFTFKNGSIDIDARANEQEVVFSVKDTGKGISAEQQKAFLKTSIRVSFGTGGEKGSGLGLLLIKEFIQANKGRVWLESKEGEGSTFYFSFPIVKS